MDVRRETHGHAHPPGEHNVKVDIIEFRSIRGSGRDSTAAPTIHPVINDVPLRELAREVEHPAALADGQPDLAGSYDGLFADDDVRWPSRHYLGEPALSWFEDGDTVLLGCDCGEWGCWPLTAKVEIVGGVVRWSGFRQGHRDWDLAALGPFEFDLGQYEEALRRTAG